MSADDRWFAFFPGQDGQNRCIAFDQVTNTVTSTAVSLNEPKMSEGGRYVWCVSNNVGTCYVWDAQANVVRTMSNSGAKYMGHAGVLKGYAAQWDGNSGARGYNYLDLTAATPTLVFVAADNALCNDQYCVGHWIDQPYTGTAQYMGICTMWSTQSDLSAFTKYKPMGFGFFRLSGGDYRLAGHTYTRGVYDGVPQYYVNAPYPNIAPDARFFGFQSNQWVDGGLSSCFAMLLPRA